ncbi:BatA domain-containing protein [Rhodocytophaga aerolata]|uniref:BatA domain-containing protein n=1 Tax=Rhodocytophaga aerolata TaxID=455078 RepID=A0ABT8R0T2_9BACT|nr:BatA domain-containing protein [Rhodocytophaga aerolata]MDO1444923.1 BatA domain-containing protein [Rhodocytophaga aerolata]
MNFLYPSFLFGLAAISIPIAIHLFNFRRTRKVYFTNVAFLKNVNTSTSSFRRLKHILILISRIAFITFLVLAFAQPFIPAGQNPEQSALQNKGLTSIYLDNSLSMQNESGKSRNLDVAVDQIEQVLNILPNRPSYQLLTNDFESRDQFVASSDKLKDRLTEINLSNTSRSLDAVYRRQRSLLEKYSSTPQNQLFWFSDFQKSTSGELEKIPLDTLNQYFIVPLQAEERANVFVDSLWLTTPFVKEMESNVLNVRFVNSSAERVDNLPVKLFIDEKQVASSTISLEADTDGIMEFTFTVQDKGFKKGRVSFEDYPVTFDNDYYFVINAAPVINIVHLYQEPRTQYVSSVFGNETVFNVKSFNINNADLAQVKTSDLVVIENLASIDATVRGQLTDFVQAGGSLLIFPGNQPDVNSYGQLLSSLGVRGLARPSVVSSSVNVSPVSYSAADDSPVNTLAPPDMRNPFFESIFENTTQKGMINMPFANPVLEWRNTGTALLQFRNNQPFLSEFGSQQGKTYLVAAPLDTKYSNFPKHALFVPVLYKIAALSKSQERLSYTFQEPTIAVDVNASGSEQVYKLKKENFEVIPSQRKSGNQLVFELPQPGQTTSSEAPESGYYELTLDNKSERILAFNYDKKESDMKTYSPQELQKIFGNKKNVQVYNSVKDGDFAEDFKAKNVGQNLWKYCLLAALFFLLTEIALIRLF